MTTTSVLVTDATQSDLALSDDASVGASMGRTGLVDAFIQRYPIKILNVLLKDRTMNRNIVWADDEYASLGTGYSGDDEITVEHVTGRMAGVIKTRVEKELEHQSKRTRTRAEVFTPSWLCNRMNNRLDIDWFRRPNVFNMETGCGWVTTTELVKFPKTKGRGWHAYVESTRLEIACGEAPFLCSRYDTVDGHAIPVRERIGILDRKLRVVGEKCNTRDKWVVWAFAALKSVYGYEYQGDNLLIARINVFETFVEHYLEKWNLMPSDDEMSEAAEIISWNIWQMDGLTDAPPADRSKYVPQSMRTQRKHHEAIQDAFFDDIYADEPLFEIIPLCIIYDWENSEPVEYAMLKGEEA